MIQSDTLWFMPTVRPRYIVTDTGDVARALDTAQRLWPDVPRGAVAVKRLIAAGADALSQERQARLAALAALEKFASEGPVYPAGYLEALREEWPA